MPLERFEGRDVLSSGVEMPGASGGLNKALAVDNLQLHHGDKGTLVIEYEVKKVRFDRVNDTEGVQRVHVLSVINAAQVDTDLVAELLAEQAKRTEEANGVHQLPYEDPDGADDPGDSDPADPDGG
jgi:hypothetical protein